MERIEINVITGDRTVIPLTQEEIDDAIARSAKDAAEQADAAAREALRDIDMLSIRAIREYIARLPDAPTSLKTLDAAAEAERKKIRK